MVSPSLNELCLVYPAIFYISYCLPEGLYVTYSPLIAYGAFVSGMKAGYGFNTFPMMGNEWKPDGLFGLTPYWKNFVEDKFSVQFIHRWMGTILTLGLLGLGWKAYRSGLLNHRQTRRMKWVVGLVSVQFLLGVSTILLIVEYQVSLPVIHQLVALFLFAALLGWIHSLGLPPTKRATA